MSLTTEGEFDASTANKLADTWTESFDRYLVFVGSHSKRLPGAIEGLRVVGVRR